MNLQTEITLGTHVILGGYFFLVWRHWAHEKGPYRSGTIGAFGETTDNLGGFLQFLYEPFLLCYLLVLEAILRLKLLHFRLKFLYLDAVYRRNGKIIEKLQQRAHELSSLSHPNM
jgi:hypothetical protein